MATLADCAIGNIVKIKENNLLTDFLVLKHGYPADGNGRTLLLRKDLYDSRQWHTSNVNAYATSSIDAWLNDGYLGLIDAQIQGQIAAVDIPYTPGNGNNTVSTLSRKVFLLSGTEVGHTASALNAEGSAISYFDGNGKRVTNQDGVAANWWLRSPHATETNATWHIFADGTFSYSRVINLLGTRPAFTLPSTLTVLEDGSIYVEPPKTLGDMATGDTVKIKENDALQEFLVLKHGYPTDGNGLTLLLRKELYDSRAWQISAANTYLNGPIDLWLQETYLPCIEAQVRKQIVTLTIPYTIGGGNYTLSEMDRQVFLLSGTEIGATNQYLNVEGSALAYFNGDSARIALYNGAPTGWWTRSPGTSGSGGAWFARATGATDYANCLEQFGTRPAFAVPSYAKVNEDKTLAFNLPPIDPAGLTVATSQIAGNAYEISWGASIDPDGDPVTYRLERTASGSLPIPDAPPDNAQWETAYAGGQTSAIVTAPAGMACWYRVCAADSQGNESGYTLSGAVRLIRPLSGILGGGVG